MQPILVESGYSVIFILLSLLEESCYHAVYFVGSSRHHRLLLAFKKVSSVLINLEGHLNLYVQEGEVSMSLHNF